jgi:hypothetical protein
MEDQGGGKAQGVADPKKAFEDRGHGVNAIIL